MSSFKGGRRGFRNFNNQNNKQGGKKENEYEQMDQNNPILLDFKSYSLELDDKHDRYERVVKLGRDITIESKRIIFLLHTIDSRKNNCEKVLEEAKSRLQSLCDVNFLLIAKEIGNLDPYQYGRAYSAGLQEFIEAYTFYEYLSNKSQLSDWDDIQKQLNYSIDVEDESSVNKRNYLCFIQPIEYIAGLADVGGEVMRRCINSLGSGDISTCFESCKSLQELYAGYLRINSSKNREIPRKVYTLKQSVLKAENVCYNVKVRGGEAAKWGSLTDVSSEKHYDDDEGFF